MDLRSIPRNLDSGNLHLRPSTMADAEGLYVMLSDPESMKYWCEPPISHMDDAIRVLSEDLESDKRGNSLCWSLFMDDVEQMIGKCILFNFSRDRHRAEIGYILNRQYWGQGVMKRALQMVIDFAFNRLELHRLEADVDSENAASLGLLESLGFEREGLFRERWRVYDEWQDSVMLGLINPD